MANNNVKLEEGANEETNELLNYKGIYFEDDDN